ncbi:MAG: BACON domain-containing protein [Bacteroidales bacterium]|nr:BACON domain-containing protein [Candidatus Equibacterium intestinale]
MKKFFSLIALCAMVLVSCQKEADSVSVDKNSWKVAYTGGEYTIGVTANGEFTAQADQDWVTVAVGDAKVDFTVAEYDGASSRTATITVTCGEAKATATVEQEAAPQYVSLGNPANCFLINDGGYYYFDATVIGNGQEGILTGAHTTSATIAPAAAKVVWDENELISDVKFKDGKIYFKLETRDGNAVIAATDAADNILWSWHIWSVEEVKDIDFGAYKIMDRNVGAIGSTAADEESAYGMYYQWGRKDPFSRTIGFGETGILIDSEAANHTIANSIAHPDTWFGAEHGDNANWLANAGDDQRNLWGSSNLNEDWLSSDYGHKTIYDPCPAGYVILSPKSVWDFTPENVDGGILINGQLFIPNASFIHAAGGGWWDPYADLWYASPAHWGDSNQQAFRVVPGDTHMNYGRCYGQPVRCMKLQ